VALLPAIGSGNQMKLCLQGNFRLGQVHLYPASVSETMTRYGDAPEPWHSPQITSESEESPDHPLGLVNRAHPLGVDFLLLAVVSKFSPLPIPQFSCQFDTSGRCRFCTPHECSYRDGRSPWI